MKEYEIVHEIFNQCSGNQMRDVFVEERELADPESYVRSRHPDKNMILTKDTLPDGTVIIDLDLSGGHQRYSFTEI
jgi:hypothetical protein